MELRLSEKVRERDAAIARGDRESVEPRDAASVILLDTSASDSGRSSEPSAFLLVRQATLRFAPGMAVFPGGGVDPRDFDSAVVGPDVVTWATRLGVDAAFASALLCAAVRETFEETGVLLATTPDGQFVDPQDATWRETRRALEAHELAFSEVLATHRLVLRSDLLTPWARWTTPRFERRRYRVWFFVARLPAGQRAAAVSTESVTASWRPLSDALADADSGALAMLPPQYYSLAELRAEGVPEAGPDGARALPVVEPSVGIDAEGAYLRLPDEILRHGTVSGRGEGNASDLR
ncbi:hypothetical protein AX769_00375 [Frondihabitans sp. PAMC 28766]|uniref:NUDIX hydrolase n=1 Tax=Frondihabitans sp. PAMC 28766 TaxID=1795630 RepID=UPI00078CEBBC|nr:NUDIX domain-containing protein [Frondihabitans sp. PAMC 28766]AMM18876.1 hypothetical protein AX769_00375 [Frondihabitans sp. PAMC 28766]